LTIGFNRFAEGGRRDRGNEGSTEDDVHIMAESQQSGRF
jgi:hypothetical protein